MFADHEIGCSAVPNRALLEDVVKHKKVFFHTGYVNYDACISGGLRLVPDEPLLMALAADLRKMLDSGMFFGEEPSLEEIADRLRMLEQEINAGASLA